MRKRKHLGIKLISLPFIGCILDSVWLLWSCLIISLMDSEKLQIKSWISEDRKHDLRAVTINWVPFPNTVLLPVYTQHLTRAQKLNVLMSHQ